MTALLLLLAVVVVLTAAAVRYAVRRDDPAEDADVIPTTWRGYRMDQVDEALDRLEAQVRVNDRTLATLRGEQPDTESEPPSLMARHPDLPDLPGPPASADQPDQPDQPEPPPPTRRRWLDLAVLTAYLVIGATLMSPLLSQATTHYLWLGVQDQQAFEWYFGVTAHNVTSGQTPLFSDFQNYPDGVNLMAQASMLGLSLPLLPITALVGAPWTFVLIEWLGLSLTATGWYWLFVRRLGVGQGAAAVGGLLIGFSPGMLSHANGHPNFVAQFLIPLIIDRTLAIHDAPDRRTALLRGLQLGALVTWQVFVGEEVLLLAAIGMGVAGLVMVAHRRLRLRRLLPGVGVGALVTAAVTAYPLWWQFRGPQSYTEIWHAPGGNDLASLWSMATMTWGSDIETAGRLAMNRTEENAFLGIGLWLVAVGVLIALRRRPVVQALGVLVLVSVWLSLGTEITWEKNLSGLPSLWALAERLPVVDNILPTRFTLVTVPALAALLALGIDTITRRARRGGYAVAGGLVAAVVAAVALAQVVPTRVSVQPRPAVPELFAEGLWRDYVTTGSVLVVPAPWIGDCRALEWQAAASMGFPLVGGYFVGPNGQPDRGGIYGPPPTPFTTWLSAVAERREVDLPSPQDRSAYLRDLQAARVDLVVLPPRPEQEALREAVEAVLGKGVETGGVVLWDLEPPGSAVTPSAMPEVAEGAVTRAKDFA